MVAICFSLARRQGSNAAGLWFPCPKLIPQFGCCPPGIVSMRSRQFRRQGHSAMIGWQNLERNDPCQHSTPHRQTTLQISRAPSRQRAIYAPTSRPFSSRHRVTLRRAGSAASLAYWPSCAQRADTFKGSEGLSFRVGRSMNQGPISKVKQCQHNGSFVSGNRPAKHCLFRDSQGSNYPRRLG